MPLYTGVTGKISINIGGVSKELLHLSNWNVDLSKDIIEGTYFGKGWKEKKPGVKDWTASFDGSADFTTDSGQKDLMDAFMNDTELEGSFYLDDDTFLSGPCIIESLSISHAADGKADISISVAGNGKPDLTTPET